MLQKYLGADYTIITTKSVLCRVVLVKKKNIQYREEADEYAKIENGTKKDLLEDNIQIKSTPWVIFCTKPDKTIKTSLKFLLKKSQKAK